MSKSYGPAGKIANYFINSKLTPLIIIASILLGLACRGWLFPVRRSPRSSCP